MYAQLGNIVFEGLKGLTAFKSKYAQTLAQHALIDGKPKLQKTGDALDELSIDMTFHRRFCNPETEIAALKAAVTAGSILPLINGMGELLGNFAVASMEVDTKHSGPTGLIVMASVTATLIEAAENDPLGAALSAAKSSAFANSSNGPLIGTEDIVPGPGMAALKNIKSADAFQASGDLAIKQAAVNTPVAANEKRKAKEAFAKVNASMDSFTENVQKVRGTLNNLAAMNAAASNIKTYSQNTISAIQAGDLDSALASSNDVRQGIVALNGASTQLTLQTIIRRI